MRHPVSRISWIVPMAALFGMLCGADFASAIETTRDKDTSPPLLSLLDNPDKTDTDIDTAQDVMEIFLNRSGRKKTKEFIIFASPRPNKPLKPTVRSTLDETQAERPKIQVSHTLQTNPSLLFNIRPTNLAAAPHGKTMGNRLTFSYTPISGLDMSLGSTFLLEPTSLLSPLYDGPDGAATRQAYNMSLNVGYSGFQVGASFSQDTDLFAYSLSGFDVGFGYTGQSWSTRVRFAEYKRERDLLFASSPDYFDRVYALEIGAAYRIYSNIHFSGRFTYYTYGQSGLQDKLDDMQIFLLGTNVNF